MRPRELWGLVVVQGSWQKLSNNTASAAAITLRLVGRGDGGLGSPQDLLCRGRWACPMQHQRTPAKEPGEQSEALPAQVVLPVS